MATHINDFTIHIATANGSGSQSANNILVRSLFRCGVPVAGKNLFPSNIQGLPTWFTIRLSEDSYLCRSGAHNIVICMNNASFEKDINSVSTGGVFIYNSSLKVDTENLRDDVHNIGIPFKSLVKDVTDSVKLKKLLINMIYVGVVAELIGLPEETIETVIKDQFNDKPKVIDSNIKAYRTGREYAQSSLKSETEDFNFKVKPIADGNKGKILIDGNTAASLGIAYGGCQFMAWYPITPSSSLAENFIHYADTIRRDKNGKRTYAVVQGEDELSSISMVLGAGWAGARAITCTSGPGVSLMGETAGFSYFAEIPAVIWNVQRGGPSTGLPTRTQQCDILASAHLSHGDTRHVLLFPANPSECFEFGQTCFDLAERLQTLVLVLSDLDIGMNLWITDELTPSDKPFDRGKVMTKADLEKAGEFHRYKDLDGDAIPYRTLPGTEHPEAGYFTRGTGHDESALYTEDHQTYKEMQDRLLRKFETAKQYVPKPVIDNVDDSKVGIIAFGSTDACIGEARTHLNQSNTSASYLRLRAYPFTDEVKNFIEAQDHVYIVEQNRDSQLKTLLLTDYPELQHKMRSVLQYDGLPIEAKHVSQSILKQQGAL